MVNLKLLLPLRSPLSFPLFWARSGSSVWLSLPRCHQAAGSHEIWLQRSGNRYTTIPNHPGDMPEGTLRAILRFSLWRATGSTGGWLVLQTVARKRVRCGL